MKLTSREWTLTGIVTFLGALAALVTQIPDGYWPVTRGTYDAGMAELEREFVTKSEKAVEAIGNFELRWLCDEWREELTDLLDIPVDDRTAHENQRILDLRERIDERDCHQWED